jgi:hypothetical protein
LDDLNDEIARFLEANPYPITQELDPDRGGYLFRIHIKAEVPDSIGLIFGDFVHNLRASLDNLMFELLGAPAAGWVRPFPVCSQPEDFVKIEQSLRQQVSTKAFRIIESVQPFHAADASDPRTRLRLLHDFWNEDKHRTSTPVVLANYVATAAAYRDDPHDKTLGFEAYFGELRRARSLAGWPAATRTAGPYSPSTYVSMTSRSSSRNRWPASMSSSARISSEPLSAHMEQDLAVGKELRC